MPSVGTAYVNIRVNTKGVEGQLDKMLAGLSKKMEAQGEKMGKDLEKGLKKTNFDAAFDGIPKAAEKASKKTSKHFDGITAKMDEVAEASIDTSDIIQGSFEDASDPLPKLKTDLSGIQQSFNQTDRAAKRSGGSMRSGLYGTQALVHAIVALAPAIVPIVGQAVPAISGIASGMTFAGLAAGAAVGSFQGVGDALKAMGEADLEPTTENLEKMRTAMADLTPEGRELVNLIHDDLMPMFGDLRDIGQQNLFPGVIEGLDSLMTRGPELQGIMAQLTGATGDVFADWGAGVASEEADEFFTYLETEAAPTLTKLGDIVGNVAAGLAEMLMAFDPLSDEFLDDLVNITEGFQEWASNLSDSPEFREFVNYLIETGPQVAETFDAFVDALVAVIEAIAPLGGPTLNILESFFRVIELIAGSKIGTVLLGIVSAMSALKLVRTGFTALSPPIIAARGHMDRAKTAARGLGGGFTTMVGSMREARRAGGGSPFAGFMSSATRASGAAKGLDKNFRGAGGAMAAAATRARAASGDLDKTAKSSGRLGTGLRAVGRNAIPIAALGAAATGTAGKFGLMNTATFAMAGAMLGPWGAAAGAGIGLIMDLSAASKDAEVNIEGLGQAFAQGPVAVAQFSALQLEAAEVDGTLEQVGISAAELGAKLAGGEDISAYTDQLRALATEKDMIDLGGGEMMEGGLTKDARAAQNALDAIETLNGGIEENEGKLKTANAAADAYNSSLGGTTTAAQEAAAANKLFNDSLIGINNALARSQSIYSYRAAIDGAAESIRTAGANSNAAKSQVLSLAQQGMGTLDQLKGVKQIAFAQELEGDIRSLLRQFPALAPALRPFLSQLNKVAGKRFKTYIDAETETATDRVRLISNNYKKLPKRVRTRVESQNTPLTMKQITRLQRQYNLTPKEVATLVSVKEEQAIRGNKNVQRELRRTGSIKAEPKLGIDTKYADIAIRTSTEKLNDLGKKKATPEVKVDNTQALADINQTETALNNIADEDVNVVTHYSHTGNPPGGATGGWVRGPGTGTSDSILWRLSNGEFIIPAASAHRLGDRVLEYLRRYGKVPVTKMATGGTVPASQNGTLAVIAEAGHAERVTPLDADGFTPAERRILEALEAQFTGGGGGDVYNVHPSQGMNEQALADLVARRVAWKRRRGAGRR